MTYPEDNELLEGVERLMETGQFDEALATLAASANRPLASGPRGRALALEVVCLERLGRRDVAALLIVETMKEEGDDIVFVLGAGMQFSDLDAFGHAEMFLRNLCELDPENHLAWYNLAVSLGREGRFEESTEMYDASLALQPNFFPAHLQRAHCLQLLNQPNEAASAYSRYLELEPGDGESWKSLAILESDRREYDAAYEAFERAAEASAEPVDVYFNWAVTAVRRGDMDRHEVCLEKLNTLEPEGWRALLTRADYEETEGAVWEAWEALREGFETTLEEGDHDAAEYVIVSLLGFANRNGLVDHAEDQVKRVFDEELFSPEVLETLQTISGRCSNAAHSFLVVLSNRFGGVPSATAEEAYVSYGVSADDSTAAGTFAVDFQSRCTEDSWAVHSIQELSGPDEGRIGVYWRSDLLDAPPPAVSESGGSHTRQ